MNRAAAFLLALLGLALLARFDRDGVLARAGTGARVLGVELRVEVKLERVPADPPAPCLPAPPTERGGFMDGRAACE